MTIQEFLFTFSFLFGVVYLLTHTPLFTKSISTFTDALTYTKLHPFWGLVGYYIMYGSLFYQILFWARYINILNKQ